MTPVLLLLTVGMADKGDAKYQFQFKKGEDSAEVRSEKDRTVIVVTSKSGIGSMVATLTEGQWGRMVVLRFRHADRGGFQHLEMFHLKTARFLVSGSEKQSGAMELYFLGPDGKQGDLAGKLNVTVQQTGGAMEVTLPAFLLTGSKDVQFEWIDAFRR
jgi:hypothetical protein